MITGRCRTDMAARFRSTWQTLSGRRNAIFARRCLPWSLRRRQRRSRSMTGNAWDRWKLQFRFRNRKTGIWCSDPSTGPVG
ncbi:hypothetical protein SLE2022_254540 [Rubroshorea leprosula]